MCGPSRARVDWRGVVVPVAAALGSGVVLYVMQAVAGLGSLLMPTVYAVALVGVPVALGARRHVRLTTADKARRAALGADVVPVRARVVPFAVVEPVRSTLERRPAGHPLPAPLRVVEPPVVVPSITSLPVTQEVSR